MTSNRVLPNFRLYAWLYCLWLLALVLALPAKASAMTFNPANAANLGSFQAGQNLNIPIRASGGNPPMTGWYDCDINTGINCLPSGLVIDEQWGSDTTTIHGTPNVPPGTYNFTITVFDASSWDTVNYSITITGAGPTVSGVSPSSGSIFGGNTVTITGTGFTGATDVKFGSLPASFSVNSATQITATAPAGSAGTVSVVVTASGNGSAANGASQYTFIAPPSTGPVSATVAANTSNNPITLNLGGVTATSVTVASGASHGTATSSGTSINYTPTPGYSGSDSFTYTATNVSGTSAPATVTVTVSPPILAITPTSLADGTVGNAYHQVLSSANGTAPYSYALLSGSLPPGMMLSTAGVLSGTPSSNGTFNLSVQSTDQYGATGSINYSINIAAPTIILTPVTLADATYGVAYSQAVSASGGNGSYSFSVVSGSLPTGMTLTNGGILNGTPASTGSYSFSIMATDGNGFSGTRNYTLMVNSSILTLSPASLPDGSVGSTYSQTFGTSGGIGPYSYSVLGGLPNGISLSSSGQLSGTPTISGIFSFAVRSADANGKFTVQPYTLTIGAPSISIAPTTLGPMTVGSAYSQTLSASGGSGPYSYAVTAGVLPSGVALSSGGVLSGTPTSNGTYNFTITATDNLSFSGSQAYSVTVGQAAPIAGNINLTVAANSNTNPLVLSLSGGPVTSVAVTSNASNGMAIASGTNITFTPNPGFAGSDSFSYSATGPGGPSNVATVSVTVTAPTVVLAPVSLAGATVASAYSATFSANGGSAPYTYSLTAGTLPTGIALSSAGVLSGTPSADGSFNFTVTATDSTGFTGARTYTLVVANQAPVAGAVNASVPANSLATPIALSLSGGAATSITVTSSPGHGTTNVSGLTLSYTPTAGYSGSDSFTYTATGPGGTSAPATVNITVSAPTLVIIPATPNLPPATHGLAYNVALTASGGTSPYSYTITGTLPAGLTFDGASGTFAGIPTTVGDSSFTISVTDANGAAGSRAYSLTVAAQNVVVPPSSETVTPGQAAIVDLTRGAVGGPFMRARLLSVSPSTAGSATLSGPFTLRFTPAAAFAGTAVVAFSLENTGGNSASSTVTFTVLPRPDPTKDAEVIGLLNAQSRAAERFASTQMANFNRRLEQLHRPTCDRDSFNANVRHGRDDVSLGSLGVALRNELKGKGRDLEEENEQHRQEKDSALATSGECKEEALAFWTDGFVNTGSNHTRGAKDNSFTTYGLSTGMDYRLSPRLVVGLGVGYGNDRTDVGEQDSRSEGDAMGLAAYLSVNPLSEMYVDALFGYNRIRFDSRRYVTSDPSNGYAHGSRDADQLFASLTASYEYRQEALSMAPYARINSSYTRLDAYSERGGGIYGLSYEEQDLRYLTSFLGLRSSYDIQTRMGALTPSLGLAWGHNFKRVEDYRIRYTDQGRDGLLYRLSPDPQDSNFLDLDVGLDLSVGRTWRLGVSYKTALGSDERSEIFRIGLDGKF